ncbi:MAG: endonuclease/exonuclease/phosphatase [Gammaproteobacteria bacterium]|nr:endonuclease/exonuclease/phosphatase [Gammaproteobacteria bacterium]
MASHFTNAQWQKISTLFDSSAGNYGLPQYRNDSVVIGSFNIRKLGATEKRTEQSWNFLKNTLSHFDLIAIQEVMDDLSGLEKLLGLLGNDYGMIVSDITGTKPGQQGNTERLAYLFNWTRVQRTALASDVTFDRSEIVNGLYNNRSDFSKAWTKQTRKLNAWEEKVTEKKAQGKKPPSKPPIELPRFISFIRQPHCVSFRIPGSGQAKPYEFLVINAHLLYGSNKREREWEFKALLEWLAVRAKYVDKLYHPNIVLLGDCNLDFDTVPSMRNDIDELLKGLNKSVLRSRKAATANFPLLSAHPEHGIIKTALRQKATYDQIGIFSNDPRLPKPEDNATAGTTAGGYDYGVFNIANLVANALHDINIDQVTSSQQKAIFKKAEFDISDHMPIWMRLKLPA